MSLSELQLSYVTELTNMGSGNAATALASVLSTRVELEPPTGHEVDLGEAVRLLQPGPEDTTVGLVTVRGDLTGSVALFVDDPPTVAEALDAPGMVSEVVAELANLVAARMITTLAEATGIEGHLDPPALARNSRAAIVEGLLALSAQVEPFVLLRARLRANDRRMAELIYIPAHETVERIEHTLP